MELKTNIELKQSNFDCFRNVPFEGRSFSILFYSFDREVIFSNRTATQFRNTSPLILLLGYFEVSLAQNRLVM